MPEGSSPMIDEARRQVEICNACRYCEGYCSAFPAMFRQRTFADADITQLANLCHNCRGCYYACQFTEPHEFALNLPAALADVRQENWQDLACPKWFGTLFHRHGVALAAVTVLLTALLFFVAKSIGAQAGGEGFYAVLSHGMMVSIFMPAFLLPLVAVGVSLRRYWQTVSGERVTLSHLRWAFGNAGRLKNLSGGHGEGCNFEDEDRFSNSRRWAHHLTMIGFLLCFASTSSGTLLHYLFNSPAPYGFFSLPKLLGVPGGIILCAGTAWLAWLKTQADRTLGASNVWGGEMAFVLLLFAVSFTGLLLYALGSTALLSGLLALHLGCVLTFFLTTPFSKMLHGFMRLAALTREAQLRAAN